MKKFLLSLIQRYTQRVLGAQAEGGPQLMVPGFSTSSDYSGLGATKYIFVQATGARTAMQAINPTSTALLGVMQNNPGLGEAMSIAYAGPSKVVAGGVLSVNALITSNASGRAAAVTSGDLVAGRVLEAAGADGDVVSALLFHPVRWSGAA
jgi:hypothetical protein